eukprot:TRINITY_DN17686_c0_g2_i1.p2 TRINITY_DN17686_c0_g2~~TRINITY_DN17686_c0_g2_i1.p2  ORF type:complete len:104 (-),score=7.64 TRINITY_DN17686_c0_g2_i1:52-363(-)
MLADMTRFAGMHCSGVPAPAGHILENTRRLKQTDWAFCYCSPLCSMAGFPLTCGQEPAKAQKARADGLLSTVRPYPGGATGHVRAVGFAMHRRWENQKSEKIV